MVGRGGTVDSSQRVREAWDGGAGGAVVDEGGLAVAWQDFAVRRDRSQGKRTNTSLTLAGRAADPHRPHPCDDDRRLAVAVAVTTA